MQPSKAGKVEPVRLFITGISGLLGLNLALEARESFAVSGCYHSCPVLLDGVETFPLDLRGLEAARKAITGMRPNVVIHAAGLTNVDECESNPELARQLNVETARHVALAASNAGAQLVHISTDHLFDGSKPWRSETDPPGPLNTYAMTKWQAEQAVSQACPEALIVRTNFFGWGTSLRTSFSDWVLRGLEQQRELTMFSDAYFTPILINDLASVIFRLVEQEATGIFNVAGSDRLTKHEFALKAAEIFEYPSDTIRPINMEDVALKAVRPRDMSLSSQNVERFLDDTMPTVSNGFQRLLQLRVEGWPETLEKAINKISHSRRVPV